MNNLSTTDFYEMNMSGYVLWEFDGLKMSENIVERVIKTFYTIYHISEQ